jgi:excisionase family DNA binding protein
VALEGYYTTTEAAGLLGLRPPTVRDAVRRGRLAVERVGGRNLVTVAEIERYRAEVLGTRGWEDRKAGAGAPAPEEGARARQRAYRERKRTQASA